MRSNRRRLRAGRPSRGGKLRRRAVPLVAVLPIAMVVLGATPDASAAAPLTTGTVIRGCTIVADPTPTTHTHCPGADLSGTDLADLDLSYADLDDADLSGANLASCTEVPPPDLSVTCSTAELTDARLNGSSFSQARVSACVLIQTTPTLSALDCGGADFDGASLHRVDFAGTDLSSADFADASLSGASFLDAALVTCYQIADGIQECPGADLSGAVLRRAGLAGFDLSSVDFSGADLTGSDLAGATFGVTGEPFGTTPTDLAGADLSHVDLADTPIGEADLTGADLAGADVTATAPGARQPDGGTHQRQGCRGHLVDSRPAAGSDARVL